MPKDRDNEFYNYVTPNDSAADAAEKARIAAMQNANRSTEPEVPLTGIEKILGKDIGSSRDYKGEIQAKNDAAATALGAADPMRNVEIRPQAPATDDSYIYYYSWIGSGGMGRTGSWKLFRAPNNDENEAKYGSRRFGGETQGDIRNSVGAGALKNQPQPIVNTNGVLTGWTIGGKVVDDSGKPMLNADGTPMTIEGAKLLTKGVSGNNASGGFNSSGGGFRNNASGDSSNISETTRDAFESLKLLFEQYGLSSLADKITGYMRDGVGPNQAALLLKQSEEYKKRFAGNQKRLAKGLNVVSEAEYLDLENAYAETLRAYGLGNMLSLDRNKNQEMFADYIGNSIAATEFKNRVELATSRVINADPSVKELFKKWYPSLTDGDLASYFLSPLENFPKLQEKATTAEIGAAALGQGLTTSLESATDLAKFGVDRSTALRGYATLGEVLPTTTKLSNIYNESRVKYTQTEGEAEVFKGSQDAATKRNRLASMERGSFSGSSGNIQGRKSSTAGLI